MIHKDKPLRKSWESKMQEKSAKKSIKLYERELQEARAKGLEVRSPWSTVYMHR